MRSNIRTISAALRRFEDFINKETNGSKPLWNVTGRGDASSAQKNKES